MDNLHKTLFLFDIDDTLTRCGSVGSLCFAQAFDQLYGIASLSTDWSTYRHVTDWGLTYEAFKRHLGRKPSIQDLKDIEDTYNQLLHQAIDDKLLNVQPVKGADQLIHHLYQSGHTVRMATGGWSYSAALKLREAGIHHQLQDIYSADLAWSRKSIMTMAIESSRRQRGTERVIYFGDGQWDVKACRDLGVPMIGIDFSGQKGLYSAGLTTVIKDYTDIDGVLRLVNDLVAAP